MPDLSILNELDFKRAVRNILNENKEIDKLTKTNNMSYGHDRTNDRPNYLDMPEHGEPWPDNIRPNTFNPSTYDSMQNLPGGIAPKDKELILLAAYIHVGNSSRAKSQEIVSQANGHIRNIIDEINDMTKYYIKIFILPVRDHDSKIECIFPTSNVTQLPPSMLEGLLDFDENGKLKL